MCSIAASKSCFIRTKRRPFFQGFCRFKGLKSSLRHLSLFPMTATRQKFLSFSFSYSGPSLPFKMTAMLSCLMTRSTTSLAVVLVVTEILTLVPWARPAKEIGNKILSYSCAINTHYLYRRPRTPGGCWALDCGSVWGRAGT